MSRRWSIPCLAAVLVFAAAGVAAIFGTLAAVQPSPVVVSGTLLLGPSGVIAMSAFSAPAEVSSLVSCTRERWARSMSSATSSRTMLAAI